MRESGLAFFTSLSLHSLAMAFLVGINLALALGILGRMPRFQLQNFDGYFRLHWYACALVFISGLALLLAYPAKALTNPVFYAKLFTLACGLLIAYKFQLHSRKQKPDSIMQSTMKNWAIISILLWVATITMGRFLAYTHEVLLASRFFQG